MSTIQTICPLCHTAHQVLDFVVGKKARCKQCLRSFIVNEGLGVVDHTDGDVDDAPPRLAVDETPLPPTAVEQARVQGAESRPVESQTAPEAPAAQAAPRYRPRQPVDPGLAAGLAVVGGLLLVGCGCLGVYPLLFSGNARMARENFERQKGVSPGGPTFPGGSRPVQLDPVPVFNPKVVTDEDVARNLDELKNAAAARRREAASRFAASNPDLPRRGEAAHALAALLNDADVRVRQAAARALVVLATAEETAALVKAVDNSDAVVRGAALEALAGLKDPRAAAAIASRLSNFSDRENAARILNALGPVAEPAVLPYLNHPDPGAREHAQRLLAAYETKDEKLLEQSLADMRALDVNRRTEAVRWLADVPPVDDQRKATVAALTPLLTDPNLGVREHASKALCVWATRDEAPIVVGFVANPNARLRQAAIEALGRLADPKAPDLKAADAVAKRLLDVNDRPFAGAALKAMGEGVEGLVFSGLGSFDPAVRIEVCRILEAVGTNKSLAGLKKVVVKDPNPDVKFAANEAGKAILDRSKKP